MNKTIWTSVIQRKLLPERLIYVSDFEEVGVIKLLKKYHLLETVTQVQFFVKNIVFEFYANPVHEINDSQSEIFHKVYVRGHVFNFSPTVINDFFGSHRVSVDCNASYDSIILELIVNVRCKWPKEKSFPAAKLSLKYSVLHKIALKS